MGKKFIFKHKKDQIIIYKYIDTYIGVYSESRHSKGGEMPSNMTNNEHYLSAALIDDSLGAHIQCIQERAHGRRRAEAFDGVGQLVLYITQPQRGMDEGHRDGQQQSEGRQQNRANHVQKQIASQQGGRQDVPFLLGILLS